jgi:hypothetical protein
MKMSDSLTYSWLYLEKYYQISTYAPRYLLGIQSSYTSKLSIHITAEGESVTGEWLLFNANLTIFQLEQVNFQWNDDELRFVLD